MCCNCSRLLITEIPLVVCQCAQPEGKKFTSEAAEENFFLVEHSSWKALSIFTFYTDLFCFVLLCLRLKVVLSWDYFLFSLLKTTVNFQKGYPNSQLREKHFPSLFWGLSCFFSVPHKRFIVFFIARQRGLLYFCGWYFLCTLQLMSVLLISLTSM